MRVDIPKHAVLIVLIGLPGAGKTSLTGALALELSAVGFEGVFGTSWDSNGDEKP